MDITAWVERRRTGYLVEKHNGECRIRLDGTQRTRLISMRFRREQREHRRCNRGEQCSFYTQLHSLRSPLRHERVACARALNYWFMRGTELRDSFTRTYAETMERRLWNKMAKVLTKRPQCVDEAEMTWNHGAVKVPRDSWDKRFYGLYWLEPDKTEAAVEGPSENNNRTFAGRPDLKALPGGTSTTSEDDAYFETLTRRLSQLPIWEMDSTTKLITQRYENDLLKEEPANEEVSTEEQPAEQYASA